MTRRLLRRFFPYLYLAVDLALTQLSLSLAVYLRRQISLGIIVADPDPVVPDLTIRLITALTWAFFLSLFAVNTGRRRFALWHELSALGQTLLASLGVLAATVFFLNYDDFPRLMFVYFAVVNAVFLMFAHIGIRVLQALSGDLWRSRRILIVGTGSLARITAHLLRERGDAYGLEVVGFLSEERIEMPELLEWPVLGQMADAAGVMLENDIHDVIIALPSEAREKVIALTHTLRQVPVQMRLVPDILDRLLLRSTLGDLAGIEMLSLHESRPVGPEHVAKRILDLAGAFAGLIVFAPLMLVIALLIRLESRGPVLFRQVRIGRNGRPFVFYKFRTMVQDADERVHREYVRQLIHGTAELQLAPSSRDGAYKLVGDRRVTQVGLYLRKSSLDELPQLFNVLKGNMSLVGPRPPIPYEVEEYSDWHKRRLEALPGITGLWQVMGRSQVSFDEMIRMDIEYIERQSFWLDLLIILKTPLAVISGRGAR